jgi:hypothetical protein
VDDEITDIDFNGTIYGLPIQQMNEKSEEHGVTKNLSISSAIILPIT